MIKRVALSTINLPPSPPNIGPSVKGSIDCEQVSTSKLLHEIKNSCMLATKPQVQC